jgi:phosphatidate cytidylyltransferase
MEGLAGGLVASVLAAVFIGQLLLPQLNRIHAVGLGLVLGLLGVAGDLFESLLKRSVGVKDTSSLFPGHGGILDRLDAVLFAAPALWLYVRFIYPH